MESQLKQAKERMEAGGHTAVACREGVFYTADERGVRPLLAWLDGGVNLSGGVAADRVVGRAAAFLYVLLGVRAVWAGILSRPAQEVFEQNGIEADCGVLVDAIRDRAGTGFCPMETAVRDISDPERALAAVRAAVARLAQGK